MDKVNIVGYGAYVPRYRLKIDEIEKAWSDKEYSTRSRRLGVEEKAIAGWDEDEVTMGYEAARNAVKRAGIDPADLGGIITGCMSRRFRDKSASAMIAQMLGTSEVLACDCVHSSKSGSSALILGKSLAAAGDRSVLVIATDNPHVAPCDDLEPLSGSGAAAFICGKGEGIASIEGSYSCSREVYDIWQPVEAPYMHYDMNVSRQLFRDVTVQATTAYMERHGTNVDDYSYFVLSQQDARAPLGVARALKIPTEKMAAGFLCPTIGDLYSASALIGMAAVLDTAKEGERGLISSYGSGGADIIDVRVSEGVTKRKDACPSVADYLNDKVYVDYISFLKHSHVI
jgi:hydroxymethylglutaryl-CoA synthase